MAELLAAGDRERTRDRPPPAAGRPLRRRQSLPSGRAVVGGFLIALAALGIFVAYTRVSAGPTTRYVVARHDLRMGTRITPDDLALLPMELPASVARNAAFTDRARLVNATVIGPIRAGELVQAGDVLHKQGGPGAVEVSLPIESARALDGRLLPGEQVDVLATFGSGADAYTIALVRGATVLSTDRRQGTLAAGRTEVVVLAVRSRDEAIAIAHAVSAGEITLIRTTGADAPVGPPPVYRAPSAEKERAER
jgi:Flp pilus assembly protein CpaB